MRLAVDGITALRALRVHRRYHGRLPSARCDLPSPDPSPQRRWTARLVPLERLALSERPSGDAPIQVAVPTPESRIQASFASCAVRSPGLPEGSFVDLGEGLFIPCPELLFLELATIMAPEAHALVGYELCGTYSRDPARPQTGAVAYDLAPATSCEKIAAYLRRCSRRKGALEARHNLSHVADNAWSPMEAILALLARLPVHELGYELGAISLNVRRGSSPELVALGCRESRVPDIEIVGTHVGFNYDGKAHLNLEAIAQAVAAGEDPSEAIRSVRAKHRDDLKRNRELAAQGMLILPVTSADLFAPGGLDVIMLEAAQAIQEIDGRSAANVRVAVADEQLRRRRQELVWSLLPWEQGMAYMRRHVRRRPWENVSKDEIRFFSPPAPFD